MIVDVHPALPIDIHPIARNMRDADVAECLATDGRLPDDALRWSLNKSTMAWTGFVDGEPIVMFGVGGSSMLSNWGVPWMLGTKRLPSVAVPFLRRNRGYIDIMLAGHSRLMNYVDARNTTSIRWLRWLGFHVGEPVPYGREGLPFHPFTMEAR